MLFRILIALLVTVLFPITNLAEIETVTIGSKRFTENYIVAEIMAQYLESSGDFKVERKFGLGGTMVAFNALQKKEIDFYPEYTGTISAVILKTDSRDWEVLEEGLKNLNVYTAAHLGFDNSYCAVIRKSTSDKLNIKTLSDLGKHPELNAAFSYEFQKRIDGWPALKKTYNLKNEIRGMEVPLTYEALKNGDIDIAEAYTTEPLIKKYDFVVLEDDKSFFPLYEAIPLGSAKSSPRAFQYLVELGYKISNEQIMELNSMAANGTSIPEVAYYFLTKNNLIDEDKTRSFVQGIQWPQLFQQTKTHLILTGLAVFLATIVAVPLGILIATRQRFAKFILSLAGIMQTIPSIALLTFMIPFFGIGFTPAIIGLFVYSLLPILQNSYVAIKGIDPRILDSARGIGLYPREILFSVKLPLAFPMILAGIRTATILNIGTATLAAFIGAGGLGGPIVQGLALNDTNLVLQGAVPAALLAIVIDGIFSLINKVFVRSI